MIEAITFIIATLGIILLLLLYSRIREVSKETALKKHRSKDESLPDLLNYAAVVDDGVIVGKNGSFMAAWLYKGADNASSTDDERDLVSARINQALSNLGNGWMLHVDAVRRPAMNYSEKEASEFPDQVSEAIDHERRKLFENLGNMYEGYFVLTLTWFPPLLAQRKFIELMFDDDTVPPNSKQQTQNLINQFKKEIGNVENRLSTAIALKRLSGQKFQQEDGSKITHDDFLSWLQFCVTGIHQPLQLPSNPMYIDSLVGGKDFWGGVVPKVGRNFIQVVAIDGFPLESTPGILSALAEQPLEYRWSTRFIFMDRQESIKHYENYRKKWKQKVRGFFDQVFNTNTGAVDQDALEMVHDSEEGIAEINSGLVAAGYYTSVIVLMSPDRSVLESSASAVEKAIARLGFGSRVETINTIEAYLGSLPGHGVENVRRPLMNTMNLADLIPTSSIWTGIDQAPCPLYPPNSPALMHCVTQGATPFRLNLHVNDLGHTLMFGPTGAGKSTHLALLALQLRRYAGMSVYTFDKGNSMYAATKAVGGQHFEVGSENTQLTFCPLQYLETKGDRAWAMEWIDTILELNGIQITPGQRNEIASAIMSMHASKARTFSEFVLTVQDEPIREALKQYTVEGMMGNLFDAEEDSLELTNFTTFEIEEIIDMGDKFALPVLLYLFRRIEKSLKGQPSAIILDEAWIMLGHEVFRNKIREWLKVLRKANCFVLMATQSLSDAANSGIFDVIVESTATKIFLPNKNARDDDASALYRRMGLNARQIEILAAAVQKRQYYYMSDNGRRLYELALGPLALSIVGASDKESIAEIKSLEAKYGDEWINKWLDSKGLNLSNYQEAA